MKILNTLSCSDCLGYGFEIKRVEFANQTIHVGAYCMNCQKHLQWVAAPISEERTSDLTHVGELEIPFGKHKGLKLKDIDKGYLEWLSSSDNKVWAPRAKLALVNK